MRFHVNHIIITVPIVTAFVRLKRVQLQKVCNNGNDRILIYRGKYNIIIVTRVLVML